MTDLGLPVNLLVFAAAAAAVWIAGAMLTRCVDAIAERKNIGRAFLGFVVLATTTQLPEVVTNSTAAVRGDARLLLNSMFGGVSLQTAVLVIADFIAMRYALTYLSRSVSTIVQGLLLVLLLAVVVGVAANGDIALPGSFGVAPVLLAGLYLFAIWLLWKLQDDAPWEPRGDGGTAKQHATIGNDRAEGQATGFLVFKAVVASLLVLVAGVALVMSAEAIAARSGLGSSFIGVTLLATATSLPEVSTTLTAVRLGRHSMAISDIFGSNLIMVALLLPSDLLYREGILLDEADPSARFALALGIVLTVVYLVGLMLRRPRRYAGLGADSWVALAVYLIGVTILYGLR